MSKLMVLICVMFVIILMVITNPSKNDYINWIKETSITQNVNSLDKGLISLIGNPLFDSSTLSRNFILFSIYTTYISDNNDMNTMGVANNFIQITPQSRYIILVIYLCLISLVSAAILYLLLPLVSKTRLKDD